MQTLIASGLLTHANHFQAGFNGGLESEILATSIMPEQVKLTMHGLQSRSENLTIVEIEQWLKKSPTHANWYVLYFHSKGASRPFCGTNHGDFIKRWRDCMMHNCVSNWRQCVAALDEGFDACGCHWMQSEGLDESQNLFGGNFWWAKGSYLLTLPSIFNRARIKQSGIDSLESRFESEVWIGNGKRKPKVCDFHAGHPNVHMVG